MGFGICPAGHSVDDVDVDSHRVLLALARVPSEHDWHEIPSLVICPDGHAVHVVCPAVEVSPGGQLSHELFPVL